MSGSRASEGLAASEGLIVAVDGGGSKTDAVALTRDGELVRRAVGPTSSPHFVGVPRSIAVVDELIQRVLDGTRPLQTNVYLSGLDLPHEVVAWREAAAPTSWSTRSTVIDNDLWALLRAGTDSSDAVAVVCGTGINAVGVRAATDDRAADIVRFAALGPISGDWGGGSGLGEEALWHAARAEDGRGPATRLHARVREVMGVATVAELTEQLHTAQRPMTDLAVLAPSVFEAAQDGDPLAQQIVDRQAAEIVAFARASLTRLGLLDRIVPIVLGGGVIRARDARLLDGIAAGLAADAPLARTIVVDAPPVVGAALLALESAGVTPDALERARRSLGTLVSELA